MDRLFSRKGSSSAASSSSAAQPALSEVKIERVQDVQRWLSTGKVSSGNLEIGSVREAVAALTRAPRPRAEDVRPLLGKWRVEQMRQRRCRPLPERVKDLEDKVIRAAQKLQAELANKPETTLAGSAAQPAATCVTSAAQPALAGSSTDRAHADQGPGTSDKYVASPSVAVWAQSV